MNGEDKYKRFHSSGNKMQRKTITIHCFLIRCIYLYIIVLVGYRKMTERCST